jgi:selenide, water dikinase
MLNAEAAAVARAAGPHAVTDVTGFGLLGHAYEMASRSGVRIELEAGALPVIPAALELAAAGVVTGGDSRNREYVGGALELDGVSEAQARVAFDPQTAGGLLVALAPGRASDFERALRERRLTAARVGTVTAGAGIRLSA